MRVPDDIPFFSIKKISKIFIHAIKKISTLGILCYSTQTTTIYSNWLSSAFGSY
jgi:hypothetical protein